MISPPHAMGTAAPPPSPCGRGGGLGAGRTWLYQINLTRACNLRCSHCYIHSRVKDASGRMAAADLVRIGHGIRAHLALHPGTHGEIHLVGGEPTLLGLAWFHEALPLFRAALAGAPAEIALVSNLIHPDAVAIAQLFDRVATSWEPSTRFPGAGVEAKWLTACERLRAVGTFPTVTCALAKPTIDFGAAAVLDRLTGWGFDGIHLGFFVPQGDGLAAGTEMMPRFAQTADFLIQAADWYVRRSSPFPLVNPIESLMAALVAGAEPDDSVCPIVSGSLDIDWTGNAATCLEAGGSLTPHWLGNVLTDGVAATASGDAVSRERLAAARLRPECAACPRHLLCKGGCGVLWQRADPAQGDCPGFRRFLDHLVALTGAGARPHGGGGRIGCR